MNPLSRSHVVGLGRYLQSFRYEFTTVTPLTHRRVLQNRGNAGAVDLRDAFGWNRPFAASLLPPVLHRALHDSGLIVEAGSGLWKSSLRFSTLHGDLFAHSGFPTEQEDAVFFGPDTYRFARWVIDVLAAQPLRPGCRILDMGCGAGPGGITAARCAGPDTGELVLSDINASALLLSRANVELAELTRCSTFTQSDLFRNIDGEFDLIVCNPPYLVDAHQRTYRHGGGRHGEGLSQRILSEGLGHLRPGGRLVLYTGSAVLAGVDLFSEWAGHAAQSARCAFTRLEIDPDVFGEELEHSEYSEVDRIAAIGLVLERPL